MPRQVRFVDRYLMVPLIGAVVAMVLWARRRKEFLRAVAVALSAVLLGRPCLVSPNGCDDHFGVSEGRHRALSDRRTGVRGKAAAPADGNGMRRRGY